jgi:triphosphatase
VTVKLIPQPDLARLRSQLPLLFAEAGLVDDPAAERRWTEIYLETATGRLARKGYRLLHRDDSGWVLLREGKGPVGQEGVYHPAGPPRGPVGSRVRKVARNEGLVPLIGLQRTERTFRAGRGHEIAVAVEEFVFIDPVDGRTAEGPLRVRAEGDASADREIRDFVMSRVAGDAVPSFDPVHAGLNALGLPEPGAPVPEALRLHPDDPPVEAARKLLTRQAAAIRANRRGAALDLDPEFLHQVRVAIRRARAALRVFAAELESPRAGAVRRELGELGTRLGRTRDLDVLLPVLVSELARVEASADTRAWILGEFRKRREATAEDARRELASSEVGRLVTMLEGLRPAANPPAPAPGPRTVAEAAGPVMEKATRKVGRWRSRPVESLTDADLHRIRIALKRLRYASEVFNEIEPAGFRKAVRRLARFQDVLGEAQDARVAIGHLRGLAEAAAYEPHPDVDRLLVLGALVHRRERTIRKQRKRFAALWNEFGKVTGKLRRRARKASAGAETEREA